MASVDNRIVNMEFNNADFQRRISDTMKSIGQLDKSIAELGTKNGLTDLAKQASAFTLGGMASAVEHVSNKFLALATIGITALSNITNKAVDAGIQLAKSLSLDQIIGGFNEYELKLGAIQTIMAGSGESLEVVNAKLKELNEYSDKTIYSFADMTQNIGKFTNAGVSLDDSVASIKGIANVAALSGANAEEASRAMYNFAQALSKGHVQLVDWKSIELANMATAEFKNQLLESAVAAGTLTKRGEEYITSSGMAITATKNFNDSLTDEWLTTEALNKTLADYADANTEIGAKATAAASDVKTFTQLMSTVKESIGSGWAETFEIIVGDFDNAKSLWTQINSAVGGFFEKQAIIRNQMLGTWESLGGRLYVIDGLKQVFLSLFDVLKPIKDAFQDIFPPMTAGRLLELSKSFNEFAHNLRPSEETIENIKRIFKGLFTVLDVGWEIIKFGVRTIKNLIDALIGLGGGNILDTLAGFGDVLAGLDAEKIVGALERAVNRLKEAFKNPLPFIQEVINKIGEFFAMVGSKIPNVGGPLGDFINWVKDAFSGLGDVLSGIDFPSLDIGTIMGKIGDFFSSIMDSIMGFFGAGGDMAQGIQDASSDIDWELVMSGAGIGVVAGLVATINRLITKGINIDFTGGVLSSLSDTFGQLTGVLKAMETNLKAEALQKIAIAIGVLAASMVVLSLIDAGDLGKALAAMAVGFTQLVGVLAALQKLDLSAASVAKFMGIAVMLGILAGGILMMAAAATMLGNMNNEEVARGLLAVTLLLGAMVGVAKVLQGQVSNMISAGVGILAIAGAMTILAISMKIFASMNWQEMARGFTGVIGSLMGIAMAMKLMPNNMAAKTAGIVAVSFAMVLLGGAMKLMATLSWPEMVKGLAGVAGGLTAIGLAMKTMPKNMAVNAVSILAVSVAMVILAKALKSFSELGWGDILKASVAIVATLTIIGVAVRALEGSLAGAVGLLLLTFALDNLAKILMTFANIAIMDLVKGLFAMALVIGVLAGAAMLVQPAIGPMMLLGAALVLIGIGIAALGAGAALIASAFLTLSKVGSGAAEAIISTLEAIGAALPALLRGFAEGLFEMAKILLTMAPQLIPLLMNLLGKIIEALTTLLPKIGEFILALIDTILTVLTEAYPQLIQAGIDLLLALLEGIRNNIDDVVIVVGEILVEFITALTEEIPKIIDAVADFIIAVFTGAAEAAGRVAGTMMFGIGIAFMQGFMDGIGDSLGRLWDLIKSIPRMIIDTIKDLLGINSPSTVMMEIGGDLIQGFIDGITTAVGWVWNFFTTFPGEILRTIGNLLRTLWSKGTDIISGFFGGLKEKATEVMGYLGMLGLRAFQAVGGLLRTLWDKGWDLLEGFAQGIRAGWDTAYAWFRTLPSRIIGAIGNAALWLLEAGKDIIRGLWNGVLSMKDWLVDKVSGIGGWVINTAKSAFGEHSPSKYMAELGVWLGEGLIIGIDSMEKSVVASSAAMANSVLDAFNDVDVVDSITATLSKVSDGLSASTDFNPVITPVVDLSNVLTASNQISSTLGGSSYLQASAIASSQASTEDLAITGVTEVKFEQTINAPTELSTAEIYRQTRNQITMAKEEFSIL